MPNNLFSQTNSSSEAEALASFMNVYWPGKFLAKGKRVLAVYDRSVGPGKGPNGESLWLTQTAFFLRLTRPSWIVEVAGPRLLVNTGKEDVILTYGPGGLNVDGVAVGDSAGLHRYLRKRSENHH